MSTADLDLGRKSLVTLAARFANGGLGFIGLIIFARVLGSSGLGSYYFLLTVSQLLVQATGGFGGGIRKRVSEVQTDPAPFFGAGLLAHIGFVVVVVPGLVILEQYLPTTVGTELSTGVFVVLLAVLTFSIGLFMIVNRMYAGLGNPGRSIWFDALRTVFTLGFQLVFLYFGYREVGLLAGIALASLVCAVLVTVKAGVTPTMPSRETFRSIGEYARWSIPDSFLSKFYNRVDVLLLGVLVGSTAVGFYETAFRLALPASMFVGAITGPLNVKVSGRTSQGDEVRGDVANAMSYAAFLAVPLFFGGAAIASPLMRTVFGGQYSDAGLVLIGILGFQVVRSLGAPLSAMFNGADRPDLTFRITVVGVVVNLPVAVMLTEIIGLYGVIVATLSAEIVMLGLLQWKATMFDGPFLPRPVISQVFSGGVMYVAVTLVNQVILIKGWEYLLVVVGAGAIVYVSVLYGVSRHFRATVDSVVLTPLTEYVRTSDMSQ